MTATEATPPVLPGVRLDSLTHTLERVREGDLAKPPVQDPAARFVARFPERFEKNKEWWGTIDDWWRQHWHRSSYTEMAEVFTSDELQRILWGGFVQSELGDYFQYGANYRDRGAHTDPPAHVLWKIRNAMCRWGWVDDYNVFVDAYEGIRRLTFLDGFDVRLDHTRGCNPRGTAQHLFQAQDYDSTESIVYLDASMGLLVYHKGEHVLTVGFSPTRHGILLAQVQLRKKKGNRWLFKLPKNYLELVIDRFHEAFPATPICLVDGASAVFEIRSFYGDRKDEFDAKGAGPRIQSFYDQPLAGYTRSKAVQVGRMTFHTLSRDGAV